MADSEEKINARASIKASQELVDRLRDEARREKKRLGLTKDPPIWTIIEAALDFYLRRDSKEIGALADYPYPKNRDDHEKLEQILRSPNPVFPAAIRHNLEAFSLIRNRVADSKIFVPASSQQELEIYKIVDRILHEVGLPQPIRQAFFSCVEEAKNYAAEHDKKLLEMPR